MLLGMKYSRERQTDVQAERETKAKKAGRRDIRYLQQNRVFISRR